MKSNERIKELINKLYSPKSDAKKRNGKMDLQSDDVCIWG